MPKNVIVYGLSNCPYCIMVKKFLEDNKIVFENKNVGEDKSAAREMIEKTRQKSVPVIDIEGKIIIGFDKEGISKELGIETNN